MIEYYLEDADSNQFYLNDSAIPNPARDSTTLNDEILSFENKIIEKTYLAGSLKVGVNRTETRNITLTLTRSAVTDSGYIDAVNELIYNLKKAVYLVDDTNDRRIKITLDDVSVNYEVGAYFRSGDESFTLICLNPYWEDLTATTVNITGILDSVNKDTVINNQGWLDVFAEITVTTAGTNGSLDINFRITDNSQELDLTNLTAGTSASYLDLIVDNEAGTIISDHLSTPVDETNNIQSGTGFFFLPVGSNTLRIFTNQNCSAVVSYRKRYFI